MISFRQLPSLQRLQSWSEERWTQLCAVYYGMCARVDFQLGMLLDALKDAGLYDDTAVFLFSDHGDYTGDYGLVEKTQNTFEDCLTRVPFIMKPPSWIEAVPGVRDALIELIDFLATVEDLTGIAPEHTHFGRSLLPLLSDREKEHRDAVFCEGGRLHGEKHCMELGSTSSLVPSGLYWPQVGLQSSEGPEHTKAVMCRTNQFKYIRRLYESDELYNLINDPCETRNLINEPSMSGILADLKERLLTFFHETTDAVPYKENMRKVIKCYSYNGVLLW